MTRLHVPPVPEPTSPAPEPDPLLEKFRQDTIKGRKVDGVPQKPKDTIGNAALIHSFLLDTGPGDNSGDCGTDIGSNCDP